MGKNDINIHLFPGALQYGEHYNPCVSSMIKVMLLELPYTFINSGEAIKNDDIYYWKNWTSPDKTTKSESE